MKKTFLKSVATGIVGLTLVGGCSMFQKETAHKCSSSTCSAKKEVTSTENVTKPESHGCNGKDSKKTKHKHSKKKQEVKSEAANKAADAK